MTYAETIRREYRHTIKTGRLIAAALLDAAERETPAVAELLRQANADKKAEAERLMREARRHCEAYIERDLAEGRITKRQRTAGLKALDEVEAEAKEQAKRLKNEETGQ